MNRSTLAALTLAALALSGCGATPSDSAAAPDTTAPTGAGTPAAGPLTVTDAWAKAQPDVAEQKMTGVFGTITNTTDAPITITSASNDRSPLTELHETVAKDGANVMQKVDGGFTVDPGASRELRPGGDHVMVMQMTEPLKPGDTVTITFTTSDGATVEFEAVAKTYTGGDEKYHSKTPMSSSSGAPTTGSHEMPGGSPTDSPS